MLKRKIIRKYIPLVKKMTKFAKKNVGFCCTKCLGVLLVRCSRINTNLYHKKKMIKKSYTRVVQWKWSSVLSRARGWTSSPFSLCFNKTLKSAEVSKILLLLYFSMILFHFLFAAGGILIFVSWCCWFAPRWRYTVTSLKNKIPLIPSVCCNTVEHVHVNEVAYKSRVGRVSIGSRHMFWEVYAVNCA